MRYTRAIPPTALLAALTSCTHPFNPTPHPTNPGQVVALAGNGETGPAMNGEWALRTPVVPAGPVATAPDGTLYFPVRQGDDRSIRIARIAIDGRLTLLGGPVQWHRGDKLIMEAGKLWILGTGAKHVLTSYSLSGAEGVRHLSLTSSQDGPTLIDQQGDTLPREAQQHARAKWLLGEHYFSAVAIGPDGKPVVALRSGELFTVPSPGRIRRWRPPGYATAFNRLVRRGHKTDVFTRAVDGIIAWDTGIAVLTSAGAIEIPVRGPALAIPIDYLERPGFGIAWAGGGRTAAGMLVLATRANPPAASVLIEVSPGGRVSRSKVHWPQTCNGGPATLAGPQPGTALVGLTVRPDGAVIAADAACHRLYEIRLAAP